MVELPDGDARTAATGSVLSDLDTSEFLRRMSPEDRRTIDDAWRDPSVLCTDPITAAVARNRAGKHVRMLKWQAGSWTLVILGWMVPAAITGPGPQLHNVIFVGALALTTWWSALRGRRSLRTLDEAADPAAAAARAVELRAEALRAHGFRTDAGRGGRSRNLTRRPTEDRAAG